MSINKIPLHPPIVEDSDNGVVEINLLPTIYIRIDIPNWNTKKAGDIVTCNCNTYKNNHMQQKEVKSQEEIISFQFPTAELQLGCYSVDYTVEDSVSNPSESDFSYFSLVTSLLDDNCIPPEIPSVVNDTLYINEIYPTFTIKCYPGPHTTPGDLLLVYLNDCVISSFIIEDNLSSISIPILSSILHTGEVIFSYKIKRGDFNVGISSGKLIKCVDSSFKPDIPQIFRSDYSDWIMEKRAPFWLVDKKSNKVLSHSTGTFKMVDFYHKQDCFYVAFVKNIFGSAPEFGGYYIFGYAGPNKDKALLINYGSPFSWGWDGSTSTTTFSNDKFLPESELYVLNADDYSNCRVDVRYSVLTDSLAVKRIEFNEASNYTTWSVWLDANDLSLTD